MRIKKQQLKNIVEGALLAFGQPLSVVKIASLFDGQDPRPAKEDIIQALEDIQASCRNRGYELKEVSSGWRLQVKEENAPWINKLWEEKPQKYSRALLETLALIAYRQPVTRGDIEDIRGVSVSSHIIRTLSDRGWVKVVGQRDVPGRPSLYATTREFLDYFNLKSLEELPSLSELRVIEPVTPEADSLNDDEIPMPDGVESESSAELDTQSEVDLLMSESVDTDENTIDLPQNKEAQPVTQTSVFPGFSVSALSENLTDKEVAVTGVNTQDDELEEETASLE